LKFSTDSLLRIINDILDFSKIDAGKIEFEKVEFEIRKLLDGLRQSFSYDVERKKISFEVDVDEAIPPVVLGDSTRLTQILVNLLGNALKFTEEGGIGIKASLDSKDDDIINIRFAISDSGIGIPEEKIDMIFESFTQASSSTTRKYGGTGLGLAITKKLVELQGGKLKVESKENEGSTFSFTLPFHISSKKTLKDDGVQKETFHSLRGMRVLVVEDNLVNQKIASKFLDKWDVEHDMAENGKVAVDLVSKNYYDLVLMDLHMPLMSGYEATLKIREKEEPYYQNLPIVALTASVFLEDREKIHKFGMNGFITKPFNPSELFWAISPYQKK
jgi:CheY-like chemotaxis protein